MRRPRKSKEQLREEQEAMQKAIAVYEGPVTLCRPGKARATNKPMRFDRAAQWLAKHWNDPGTESALAKGRRVGTARQRERIAKRNTPLLKVIAKQERKLKWRAQ